MSDYETLREEYEDTLDGMYSAACDFRMKIDAGWEKLTKQLGELNEMLEEREEGLEEVGSALKNLTSQQKKALKALLKGTE